MDVFAQSWQGKASLSTAFWWVYVVVSIILWLIISFIVNSAAPSASMLFKQNLIFLFLFPYTLFSAICVWRCGKNSTTLWSILSKIVVIFGVVFSLLSIVVFFSA